MVVLHNFCLKIDNRYEHIKSHGSHDTFHHCSDVYCISFDNNMADVYCNVVAMDIALHLIIMFVFFVIASY